MSRQSNHTLWLLYHPPMSIARTGHAGLAIAKNNFEFRPEDIIFYFSFYHNHEPEFVRKKSFLRRLRSFRGIIIDSYISDIIMRGEKENIAVGELLNTLPADNETREKYFETGQFRFTIKLSSDVFDPAIVQAELERLSRVAEWAMFSPLSGIITLNPNAYNCCSAIESALQKGRREQPVFFSPVVNLKLGSIIFYAAFAIFSSESIFSFESRQAIYAGTALLFLMSQFIHTIDSAREYANDMILMAKHAPSLWAQFQVYALCMTVSALAFPVTCNVRCRSFLFPSALYTQINKIPGAIVYYEDKKYVK